MSSLIMRLHCIRNLGFRVPFYWSLQQLYWDKKGQYYWDKIGILKHTPVKRNLFGIFCSNTSNFSLKTHCDVCEYFFGNPFCLNNIVLFCPNKTTIRRKTKNHTPVKRKPETQSGFIMRINCTRSLGFRIPFYWSRWSLYWDK